MNESISEIQRFLQEINDHLKAGTMMDKRKAVAKLERIAALVGSAVGTVPPMHIMRHRSGVPA
jgi:fructose 1,6-bisphosphatase